MKIFEGEPWPNKVNFVDKNNVVIGYDMQQNCCEDADWFISPNEEEDRPRSPATTNASLEPGNIDLRLEDYDFDPSYFKEVVGHQFDEGKLVRFRLVDSKGKPDLFLHIFNSHNGYYGHGFVVSHSGKTVHEGVL